MHVPVNHRERGVRHQEIIRDVQYALNTAAFYTSRVPGGPTALRGQHVLEIGPGYSLGSALVLASYGAIVSVADVYPPVWNIRYHRAFFSALFEELAGRGGCDPAPVRRLLQEDSFDANVLNRLHCDISDLANHSEAKFDCVFSCAVLEHVADVPQACNALSCATKHGGIHVHQVDFRDHRDFDRPLEFLTIPEDVFRLEFANTCGERGNRWRPMALSRAFEAAGLRVEQFCPNSLANEGYLCDVVPRIEATYRELMREELQILGGYYFLRRT